MVSKEIKTKRVLVRQGTPEWLEWRKGKITGTGSAAVMGVSPYVTKRDYYFEFAGFEMPEDDSKEFIFSRGHAVEEELRELLFDKVGVAMPEACFETDDKMLACSVDGYLEGVGIAEMKYVGKEVFDNIADHGLDYIPAHHMIQMQKNMALANVDICFYCIKSSKKDTAILEVKKNDSLVAEIINADYQFIDDIKNGNVPQLTSADTLFIQDIELENAASKYITVKKNIARLTSELKGLEEQIKKAATHNKCMIGSLSVTRFKSQSPIDYKKVPELQGLEQSYLDSFRGKERETTRITIKGDKNE